jgi:hypothetical protein
MQKIHTSSERGISPAVKLLAVCIAVLLAFITIVSSAPDSKAFAAAKKYKVTLTIKMGKKGCECPLLIFKKSGKTYYSQAVSKWYIDGEYVKDPFTKSYFFKDGWKFSEHNIKVVMSKKLAKGTYKVSMDNGKITKSLGSVKVKKKAVKKTFKFA